MPGASSAPGTAAKNYTMEKSLSDALIGSAPKVGIPLLDLKELCVAGGGGEERGEGRGEKRGEGRGEKEAREQIEPFPEAEEHAGWEKFAGGKS